MSFQKIYLIVCLDSLSYHGANKAATDSKIDFTKSGTFGTKEIEKDKKIKTHGKN